VAAQLSFNTDLVVDPQLSAMVWMGLVYYLVLDFSIVLTLQDLN
jgi:hypothetical protein